jgi:hypothetical protein
MTKKNTALTVTTFEKLTLDTIDCAAILEWED